MRSFSILSLLFALSGLFSVVHARGHTLLQTPRHKPRGLLFHSNDTTTNSSEVIKPEKRGDVSGVFSWYPAGLGACGSTNTANDFIVALNTPQWDGGSHCYEMITLSYQGKTTTAQIVDQCPTCPYGQLDLTHGLFAFLIGDPEQIGTVNGEWSWGADGNSGSSSSTTTSTIPPPSTTSTTPETTPTSTTEQTFSSSQPFTTSSTVPTSSSVSSSSVAPSTTVSISTSTTPTASPTSQGLENLQQFDIAVVQIAALAIDALFVQG